MPEFEAMIQSAKCLESKLEHQIWMPTSHGMLPTMVQICNTGADVGGRGRSLEFTGLAA